MKPAISKYGTFATTSSTFSKFYPSALYKNNQNFTLEDT